MTQPSSSSTLLSLIHAFLAHETHLPLRDQLPSHVPTEQELRARYPVLHDAADDETPENGWIVLSACRTYWKCHTRQAEDAHRIATALRLLDLVESQLYAHTTPPQPSATPSTDNPHESVDS